jgi:hypothetical protein
MLDVTQPFIRQQLNKALPKVATTSATLPLLYHSNLKHRPVALHCSVIAHPCLY